MNVTELQQARADIQRRLAELQTLAEKVRISNEVLAVLRGELAKRDFTRRAIA